MKKQIDDVVVYQGREWRVAGINEEVGSTYLNRANEMGPGVENLTLPTKEVDELVLKLRPGAAKEERRQANKPPEWVTYDEAARQTGRAVSTIRKWVRNLEVTEKNGLLNKSELISYSRHMDAVTGRAKTNSVPPSKQPPVEPVKDMGFTTKKVQLLFEDGRACEWDLPVQYYDDLVRGAWMSVQTDNHSFGLQVPPPAPPPAVKPPEVGSVVEVLTEIFDFNTGVSVGREWRPTVVTRGAVGNLPAEAAGWKLLALDEGKTWRRVTR